MSEKPVLPHQNRRHILTVSVFLFAALAVCFILWSALGKDPNKVPAAMLDKQAMPFSASWLQGQEHLAGARPEGFRLDDFKGRPLVLNFWASWCYSCRAEARDFEAFWQRYKDRGIAVVGIAIQDTPEQAMQFARTYGKTYILGLDGDDGKAAIDYGVTGVPETYFINKRGVLIHKEAGPVTTEMLARYADELLKE